MVKRDHPCAQDCPNRTGICRLTCTAWKEYVKKRNAAYEYRDPELIYSQYLLETRTRFRRRKEKSKRH